MPPCVELQCCGMCKRLPTYLATVWLFSTVNALVHSKLRALCKTYSTVPTTMRFQLFMSAHVLWKMPLQHFITYFAMKSLDIGMNAVEMFFQCISTKKRLPTNVTNVIPDFLVPLHMESQICRARKTLVTLCAAVRT